MIMYNQKDRKVKLTIFCDECNDYHEFELTVDELDLLLKYNTFLICPNGHNVPREKLDDIVTYGEDITVSEALNFISEDEDGYYVEDEHKNKSYLYLTEDEEQFIKENR